MATPIQEKILKGLFAFMCSIARILIRNGIGFREFADLSKAAFVQVSTSDYGIRGRPTNISRVAVMTGLTRKEVKRIREFGSGYDEALITKRNPLAELIHYWNTGAEYCDDNGSPLELPFDGDGASFWNLVRRFAGDIPPGAMRAELKRIEAITESADGRLRIKTRQHLPLDSKNRTIIGINFGLRTLADTVAFNGDPNHQSTRSQKFVDSPHISRKLIPKVQKELDTKINEFVIGIDEWFAELETQCEGDDDTQLVGVGVYFYADN
jgi:hypothetical protein